MCCGVLGNPITFFSVGSDDSKLFWGAHFFGSRKQKSVTERRLTMEKLAVKERFTNMEFYKMKFTSIYAFRTCFCQVNQFYSRTKVGEFHPGTMEAG